MMPPPPPPAVVTALLHIIDQARPEIDWTGLSALPDGIGQMLLDVGMLQPAGNRNTVVCQACHDDHVVDLEFDAASGGFRYFCPEAGWVPAAKDAVRAFSVDFDAVVRFAAGLLGVPPRSRPVMLVDDHLWDLGEVWLGTGRASDRRKTSLFLARRFDHRDVQDQIVNALGNRQRRAPAAVITLSNDDRHTALPIKGWTTISIMECGSSTGQTFALDVNLIVTRIHGVQRMASSGPVRPSPDFRSIWVGDREFVFRGDKHRQIVEYLHDVWDRGLGRISVATMFADLEFETTSRLRDVFKDHPDWKDLIGSANGACWLRIEELLEEQQTKAD